MDDATSIFSGIGMPRRDGKSADLSSECERLMSCMTAL
jgi:hypothetical protein